MTPRRMLYDAEHQNLLILQTIEGAARPEELRYNLKTIIKLDRASLIHLKRM